MKRQEWLINTLLVMSVFCFISGFLKELPTISVIGLCLFAIGSVLNDVE